MKFYAASLLALLPSMAVAQRPSNTSICDYYTQALFMNNTATSQYALLTALVNTAAIGNWTPNAANVKVNGILNPGMYNGVHVNLLPYFDGSLKSTNRSGVATSVNFLDGGGAAPLMMGKPANDDSSNQYKLLTHLYQYFGALLGCSTYGEMGFPSYMGDTGMRAVHGFMALGPNGNGYFIQQVGLAAASFGVAMSDVTAVGTTLTNTFNYRCAAPTAVLPSAPAQLQAICQATSCPIAPNPTCAAYPAVVQPMFVNGTTFMPGGAGNASATSGSTPPAMVTANAASSNMISSGLVAAGLLGLLAL